MARRKMISPIETTYHNKKPNLEIDMRINLGRFEAQYEKAQYLFDSMVMTHMVPFMPMVTGTFVNLTKARSAAIAGTGEVYAAPPPYGRFLYEGKTMVSPSTGSTWAEKGEKKVLVSQYEGRTRAKEYLTYDKNAHPEVQARWFDAAKERYGNNWVEMTKKMAGGGNRG